MLYTPLLPDVAGGVVDARFVTIPLAGTLNGVRKVRGRVDSVDLEQRTLTFTDLERRSRDLSWDRLVLTPGSVTRLFDIPGLATYARGLKSTAEALYLRDHVLEQLELAGLDDDPDSAAARRTIVVVGASYSGTELTAQLRALADAAAKQIDFDSADVKFLLLDLAEQVMPEVGEKLGNRARRVLVRRGIDVRLGLTLTEVHADHVVLSDGSRVDTRTVAWVTGVTAAAFANAGTAPVTIGTVVDNAFAAPAGAWRVADGGKYTLLLQGQQVRSTDGFYAGVTALGSLRLRVARAPAPPSVRAVQFHAGTRREKDLVMTDGGRVLAVTALGDTLAGAKRNAYEAVGKIHFQGGHYRRDIADKALRRGAR